MASVGIPRRSPSILPLSEMALTLIYQRLQNCCSSMQPNSVLRWHVRRVNTGLPHHSSLQRFSLPLQVGSSPTQKFLSMASRCPNGSCVQLPSDCPPPLNCSDGEQLCLDGICRPECPLYDGCNGKNNTFLCPTYECVAPGFAAAQCSVACNATYLHHVTDTHICWDGFCADCYTPPSYIKPLKLNILIDHTQSLVSVIIHTNSHNTPTHMHTQHTHHTEYTYLGRKLQRWTVIIYPNREHDFCFRRESHHHSSRLGEPQRPDRGIYNQSAFVDCGCQHPTYNTLQSDHSPLRNNCAAHIHSGM